MIRHEGKRKDYVKRCILQIQDRECLQATAGEKQDETGQETVAFQLLEFFFYQVT